MPAIQTRFLIGVALCGGALSGCTTVDTRGGEPVANYSYSGGAQLQLPETMSVVPTFYAGSEQSERTAYQVASLDPKETAPEPVEANAFVGMPKSAVEPARVASLPVSPEAAAEPLLSDSAAAEPAPRGTIDALISKYAALYDVPEDLVRKVVKRESNFLPTAYNKGHWGLMQIKHATARGMGYDGPAKGLLDAETNLKFAVKYLRGAFLVAQGDHKRADRLYQTGYYYHAKRMGLLDETGLGKDRRRNRV